MSGEVAGTELGLNILKAQKMGLGAMLGVTATIGSVLIGGMNMFGNNQLELKEIVAGMSEGNMRGVLEHFEYKLDELKRELGEAKKKVGSLEEINDALRGSLEKAKSEIERLSPKKKK